MCNFFYSVTGGRNTRQGELKINAPEGGLIYRSRAQGEVNGAEVSRGSLLSCPVFGGSE